MTLKPIYVLALCLALASCGKKEKPAQASQPAPVQSALTIAYVDVDSLQEKYQYCVDGRAVLEEKAKTYQTAIQQKENALQNLQTSIQQRMQNGQITTEEQYKNEVAKFEKQQNAYAEYRQKAEIDMAQEQGNFAKALQDSLDNFLAEYNKTKKYSIILNKAVMLHADKAMDITDEVTAGLNKRYKKSK